MHRNTMTKVSFAALVILLCSTGISYAQQAITCFGGDMSGVHEHRLQRFQLCRR